jgi:broad specificity phosphatase PhoE
MPPNNAIIVCYLARHGATTLNQNGMFRGNMNPPLAPAGIKEAHNLAKIFSEIDIGPIFCSDKMRATQTADIIARTKKVEVHPSEALRALDVGDFSGTKRTPESESALQKYLDSPDSTIPGGESLNQFKARISPCLQEAIEVFCHCGAPPLVVCHSSIIHEVGSILSGKHDALLVDPGGIVAVYSTAGKISAEPILKPVRKVGTQAETIT